MEMLNMRIKKL